jgi:hypothetical protein
LPAAHRAAVCPLCGTENDAAAGLSREGQRVFVDRSAFLWRPPRRFEVVVAQVPDNPRTLCVKRVIGLPGERVKIAEGEIWNGHEIVRKSPREQLALGVGLSPRVSNCPADSPAIQWQDPTGHWRFIDGCYVHAASCEGLRRPGEGAAEAVSSTMDWLVFHPTAAHGRGGGTQDRILDESPYDQSESRRLNVVRDIVVCARVAAAGDGELLLAASAGGDAFEACLDLGAHRGCLRHNHRNVSNFDIPSLDSFRPCALEWGMADHQARLVMQGCVVLEYRYQPIVTADAGGSRLAIGARDASVKLLELQVFRDVYYISGPGEAEVARQLGADEYFLLGDNSAHSMDSRHWSPRGGLAGMLIVGKAIGW